jgi:hypothetical protein
MGINWLEFAGVASAIAMGLALAILVGFLG